MQVRVVVVLLLLVSMGLGIGFYLTNQRLEAQQKAGAALVDQLKGELVRAESRLNEQVKVNASLETNLARRVEEVGLYSNKLGFITTELSRTETEAKAAAEKARKEIEDREKRIVGLTGEKDDLTARLDEMSLKIQGLQSAIREAERRLASSEGDREILKKELRRMLAEKADLEKRFADLSEVNAQIRRLREEAFVARRMEIIRKGVINFDQKGATLLQQGIRRPAPTNATRTDGGLEVELRSDGDGRVVRGDPIDKK